LVIVGAGLSGLSAANFFQDKTSKKSRVLMIDNHDDFGGHAKRNEFHLDGKTYLATGGSEMLVPLFTPESMALLKEMSVDLEELTNAKNVDFYLNRDLHQGIFFDEAYYKTNRLVVGKYPAEYEWESDFGLEWGYTVQAESPETFLQQFPMSEKAKNEILNIYNSSSDYFPGQSRLDIIAILKKTSYSDFLRKYAGVSEEVVDLFRACPEVSTGVGLDAVSAYQAIMMYRFPGMSIESLTARDDKEGSWKTNNPMPKHTPIFPDGNSSVARLLVRRLIPEVASGSTMADVVTAKFDYRQLDRANNPNRIRLNSTVVHVAENDNQKVDVTYVKDGVPYRVRAKHCILASQHTMGPYICPSLPSEQKQAMSSQTKIPVVYANVLISNWRAFEKLGIDSVYSPHGSFPKVSLDYPISIGGYEYSDHPDKPIVVHMRRSFNRPNSGLSAREQYRLGRQELYSKTFESFERDIREQLNDILSPAGFDPATDIKAITVNRWPHGYCYKQNYLFDPEYPAGQAPNEIARKQFGNIAIANADSAGFTTIFFAMEHAYRAVEELLS
jgi:spermidine dehydrogenase